jgi:hypothetical protein
VSLAALDRETTDLLRRLAPRVLSAVVRRYRDFAAGEDAVQEALLAAARQWPEDRRSGQSGRLAGAGRLAPDDRPYPRRDRPAAARGDSGGGRLPGHVAVDRRYGPLAGATTR